MKKRPGSNPGGSAAPSGLEKSPTKSEDPSSRSAPVSKPEGRKRPYGVEHDARPVS